MRIGGTGRAAALDRALTRSRRAFVAFEGAAAARRRRRQIAKLPTKRWRGVRVFRLTCGADFGCGPHVQWMPEYVLWSLIDLQHWTCSFHR